MSPHLHTRAPELLAPAGSLDAFLAALDAGADAVYTGAGAFNARAAASDLTCEELAWACGVAHDRGARVYVTMNIFVRDDELDACVELARRVLGAGADALIVADAGLCRRLRGAIPGVEIHLSTQAGVHAAAGALLAASELGASRVTCGRELTVAEIADMAATGVEIEAFCHGAICICYAGACSFSARRRGRSANRGDCTQPCRVPYRLIDGDGVRVDSREGDLLLCPRDYLSAGHLDELVRAGVGALKIEGRMKNPDYVYNVVSCYREALDAALERAGIPGRRSTAAPGRDDAAEVDGGSAEVDGDAAVRRLARSFNRGFTDGYLVGETGAGLMSWERSCNQGVRVGKVIDRRREEVLVAFEDAVDAGDTLEVRFIPGPNTAKDAPKRWPMVPCPVSARAGDVAWVRCKRKVEVGAVVNLVRSERLIEAARDRVEALRADAPRFARDGDWRFGAAPASTGSSSAQTDSSTARSKGEGPACPAPANAVGGKGPSAVICIAGSPREAIELLAGEGPARTLLAEVGLAGTTAMDAAAGTAAADTAATDAPARFEVAVFEHRLLEGDAEEWAPLIPSLGVVLDEVSRERDGERQRELCRRAAFAVCRNLTQVAYAREAGREFEVASPVTATNSESVRELVRMGARRVWLPEEMEPARVAELAALLGPHAPVAVWAFGEARLMVCEHCLLTAEGPCAERCATCSRRLAPRRLVERDGSELPVEVDALGRTRIYDAEPLDAREGAAALARSGAASLVIDFTRLRARC